MSGLVDDLADEGENADGQRSDGDGDDAHFSLSSLVNPLPQAVHW